MKKSNDVKAINRMVKKINRNLKADVFGDRFWVRQYQKARTDGMDWFLYEVRDRLEPERNFVIRGWLNVFDAERKIYEAVNDFIVCSDFWAGYFNDPTRYKADLDTYKLYPQNY